MKFKALLLAAALTVSVTAEAKIFIAKWSGDMFNNNAVATGKFNINTAVYPELGGAEHLHATDSDFQILSVKITGASSGNGSFTQSDFNAFAFAANTPLNYNHELVGQLMGNGYNFGSFGAGYPASSGDFNLFASTSSAPTGTNYFILTTSNGGGDNLALVSLSPGAVPEPASWALIVAGFGLVGAAARRRKGAAAAA